MRQKLRLYRHYVSIVVRGMMQYKTSFLFTAIGQFLVSFNVFLGIYFLFQRFHQVKGYSYSEVLLCYAIVLMEFSLAEMWARGFDTFSGLVRSGEFDRVLVRPQGEILQVLGSRFELTRLGRMLQAVLMLVYALCTAEIRWTAGKVWTILFMLAGHGCVLRVVPDLCGAVFFYPGGAGVYERADGRSAGVWQISVGYLWQAGLAAGYCDRALCPDPVLSTAIHPGTGHKPGLHLPAPAGTAVSAALLWAVAVWGEAL